MRVSRRSSKRTLSESFPISYLKMMMMMTMKMIIIIKCRQGVTLVNDFLLMVGVDKDIYQRFDSNGRNCEVND